jgi:hypothetical protein
MEKTTLASRLITAQSALDTTHTPISAPSSQVREMRFYATYGAGTSAGVVTIEGAPDAAFAGVWASLGTIPWVAASKVESLRVEGVHASIRARISTAIVGGTVSVDVVGN